MAFTPPRILASEGLVWRDPPLSHEHSLVTRTQFVSDVPQSTSSQSSHRCTHTLAPHSVRQVCPTLGGRCNSAEPDRFTNSVNLLFIGGVVGGPRGRAAAHACRLSVAHLTKICIKCKPIWFSRVTTTTKCRANLPDTKLMGREGVRAPVHRWDD